MENPFNMDDLGVPPFKETPICNINIHVSQKNIIYIIDTHINHELIITYILTLYLHGSIYTYIIQYNHVNMQLLKLSKGPKYQQVQ